jgi:dTDP-4-amino-4,6-dideoxy-D-galactose acyltransferase
MNKIIYLNWDSDFFNFNIGKIIIDSEADLRDKSIFKNYDLVYVFSKEKLSAQYTSETFKLIDSKILFERKNQETNEYSPDENIEEYQSGELKDDLLNLALQSGEYSRFKTDSNFKIESFVALYTTWIQNSIDKKNADHTYVYKSNNKIVGLITLQLDNANTHTAQIGLLATDHNFRGKGIAKSLMRHAMFVAQSKGFENIQVATQFENKIACAFYKSLGCEIVTIDYIYHNWL